MWKASQRTANNRDRALPIVVRLRSGADNGDVDANGAAPHDPCVPPSLSLIAFKDVVEFSYLFDNFVWRTFGSPWFELCAKGRMGKLAHEACQAFAQSVFGRHHHQKEIEIQGQVLYSQAVKSLSQRLDSLTGPGAQELIVPILLLLMHAVRCPCNPVSREFI